MPCGRAHDPGREARLRTRGEGSLPSARLRIADPRLVGKVAEREPPARRIAEHWRGHRRRILTATSAHLARDKPAPTRRRDSSPRPLSPRARSVPAMSPNHMFFTAIQAARVRGAEKARLARAYKQDQPESIAQPK